MHSNENEATEIESRLNRENKNDELRDAVTAKRIEIQQWSIEQVVKWLQMKKLPIQRENPLWNSNR